MKAITYRFEPVERCNMCGAAKSNFKMLGRRLNRPQGLNPRTRQGISTTIVKCKKCGLIFSNPQPVPANIQDHYGAPPETYWTSDYFNVKEGYFAGEIAWLKKLIDFKPGIKTLDIGAGIGKCMIVLEREGCQAYGLESSEPFYERAINRMHIAADRLALTTIEKATYPENYFDFVTFGAVLEHLYDPAESMNKAFKWLKPSGVMHIEVPNAAWLGHKIINAGYKVTGSGYVGNLSPMHRPFHLYEFSLRSFGEYARIHDCEIADHGYYVCNTFMPRWVDAFLKPWMKWTDTGKQLAVWLRKK